MVEPPADGEHAQHLLGRRRESRSIAHHQRVAQRRRQRAAAVEAGREQLLGEQRVALAAREQAVDAARAPGGAPRMSASCSASSSRVSGASSIAPRARRRARARPAAGAAGGGGAARRGGRWRRRARARGTGCGARKARNARVERSAQCRSSIDEQRPAPRAPSRVEQREQRLEQARLRGAALVVGASRRAAPRRRARAAAPRARRGPRRAARRARGRRRAPAGAARATSGA